MSDLITTTETQQDYISLSDLPEITLCTTSSSSDSFDMFNLINRLNELQIVVNRTFDLVSRTLLSTIPATGRFQTRSRNAIEYNGQGHDLSSESEYESTDGTYSQSENEDDEYYTQDETEDDDGSEYKYESTDDCDSDY